MLIFSPLPATYLFFLFQSSVKRGPVIAPLFPITQPYPTYHGSIILEPGSIWKINAEAIKNAHVFNYKLCLSIHNYTFTFKDGPKAFLVLSANKHHLYLYR